MRKPNILLVNPFIHDFTAYDFWIKPLGLYWIAGFLKQYDFNITIIDCINRYNPDHLKIQGRKQPRGSRFGYGPMQFEVIDKPKAYAHIPRKYKRYGIPLELFKSYLKTIKKPDIILVGSMMTYWYLGVFETISILKDFFPHTPIALGGVYATLCTKHATSFSGADKVFSGPGEVNVLQWVDSILGINREYNIPSPIPVEKLHLPAHELHTNKAPAAISTTLGCPLTCSYCASRILQPCFRKRSVSNVLEEITFLVRNKRVKDIAFYDDALLIDAKNHIIPILQGVMRRNLEVRFHTPNGMHSRPIYPELAKIMFNAGIKTLRLSYEMTSIYSSTSTKSTEDPDLAKAVHYLQEAGFGHNPKIEVYIKTGLPGQTIEEIVEGFLFVHKLGAYIRISDYSAVPGTEDFETVMKTYNLSPDEPLYQSNTALPFLTGHFPEDLSQSAKSLAGTLNFALEREINLLDRKGKMSRLFLNTIRKMDTQ